MELLLLVIPFEDTGAMETFLLNAIANDSAYDTEIIRKGNQFVEEVDKERKYLAIYYTAMYAYTLAKQMAAIQRRCKKIESRLSLNQPLIVDGTGTLLDIYVYQSYQLENIEIKEFRDGLTLMEHMVLKYLLQERDIENSIGYAPIWNDIQEAFTGEDVEVLNIGDSVRARRIIDGTDAGRHMVLNTLERLNYL